MIFTRITVFVLGAVALAHVYRVMMGWEFLFAGIPVPPWVSILAAVIAGLLAVMVWQESWKGKSGQK